MHGIIPLEHVAVQPLCLLSLCLREHLKVAGKVFLVRRVFIQECFNVEKSHMSFFRENLFLYLRLINWNFCFVYIDMHAEPDRSTFLIILHIIVHV